MKKHNEKETFLRGFEEELDTEFKKLDLNKFATDNKEVAEEVNSKHKSIDELLNKGRD